MVAVILRYGVVLLGMVGEIWCLLKGNTTDEVCKNILSENLFQLSQKLQLGSDMVFQHDNVLTCSAHVVKHRLDEKRVERLILSSFSPDFNPIDHLWDELGHRMKKYHTKYAKELHE